MLALARSLLELLDQLWATFDVIDLDRQLSEDAASDARRYALRAYDAVHCSAARALDDDNLVAVARDGALLDAWRSTGLATCNVKA